MPTGQPDPAPCSGLHLFVCRHLSTGAGDAHRGGGRRCLARVRCSHSAGSLSISIIIGRQAAARPTEDEGGQRCGAHLA
eukprot:6208867-Pleurochrysis_carterae.AAC.2